MDLLIYLHMQNNVTDARCMLRKQLHIEFFCFFNFFFCSVIFLIWYFLQDYDLICIQPLFFCKNVFILFFLSESILPKHSHSLHFACHFNILNITFLFFFFINMQHEICSLLKLKHAKIFVTCGKNEFTVYSNPYIMIIHLKLSSTLRNLQIKILFSYLIEQTC